MILNKRTDPMTCAVMLAEGTAVDCGRPGPWGNPYVVGEHGSRDMVIARHRRRVQDGEYDDRLHELVGKALVCYCAPKSCHCDNYVERMVQLWGSS